MDENDQRNHQGLERRDQPGSEEVGGRNRSQSGGQKGDDDYLVQTDTLFGFFELPKSVSRPLKFGIGLLVVGYAFVQGYVSILRDAKSVISYELISINKDVEILKESQKDSRDKIEKLQEDVNKLIWFQQGKKK